MANVNGCCHGKTLPRVTQNAMRPFISDRHWSSKYSCCAHTIAAFTLRKHQYCRHETNHIHQSKRQIHGWIKPGQPIYHGHVCQGWQSYSFKPMKTRTPGDIYQAYQKCMQHLKDRGSPSKNTSWTMKYLTCFCKKVRCNGMEYKKGPPHSHRWNHFQGSFHCHPCWHWQVFPHEPIGLLVTPGRAQVKHVTPNKHWAGNVSICIHAQPTWLLQNTTGTLGVGHPHAQQTRCLQNMGWT